jgi:hypothetical protein
VQDEHVVRAASGELKERRFTDAGLAAEDERAAPSATGGREQPVELRGPAGASNERCNRS